MNLVIVDDSKAVHAFINELLLNDCESITHCYNGQEVLDLVTQKKQSIDLVLLDWEMPILSGIETLPKLRALNAELPIMMMTSKNAMSAIIMALENGAQDYIIKPFTKDILIGKIEQVLGRKVA